MSVSNGIKISGDAGHWSDIARLWEQVGPPLRPSAEDVAFAVDAAESWIRSYGVPRVLLLGVTPELYRLPWPDGTDVLAIDHTQDMIDHVWPGPKNAARCAEWTDLPLEAGSRDIVLCDGGIHLLAYPDDHSRLVRMLYRVLAPGGVCIFRLFVPPKERESPDGVFKDLLEAKVANMNLLKLRLGMALQADSRQGVQLGQIWNALHEVAPDFGGLAARIGWPPEHMRTIFTYRGCSNRYYFLSTDEVSSLFCDESNKFKVQTIRVPVYELGERCPTIVLRRTADDARGRMAL